MKDPLEDLIPRCEVCKARMTAYRGWICPNHTCSGSNERLLALLKGLEVDEKAISYLLSHPPYHCENLGKDISKHCHRINGLLEKYFREELTRDAIDLAMKNSFPVD